MAFAIQNLKTLPSTKAALIQKRINVLAALSDNKKGLSRQFGTPAFKEASKKIREWMQESGLETREDAAKNIRGLLRSTSKNAKTFVIGSHFDTIENSGKYNGSLGILIGLEAAASLLQQKTELPFNLEVIAFSEGEGVRFHSAHFGSKAIAGMFDEQLLFLEDEKGISLKSVLSELNTDYNQISKDHLQPGDWMGYLDIHIEPGDQLREKHIPVAIASNIYGHKRIDIQFIGEAGHSGSVSMDDRKDALAAAAKFVLKVENYASKERNGIMATIGRLKVINAATNVIPSNVKCSLDMRSLSEDRLNAAYEEMYTICEKICHKRGIYFEWKLLQETMPVVCDDRLNQMMEDSIKEASLVPVTVISGLATEATILRKVAPVSILFVRDSNGVSYNPNEKVLTEDIQKAVDVTENFIKKLAGQKF